MRLQQQQAGEFSGAAMYGVLRYADPDCNLGWHGHERCQIAGDGNLQTLCPLFGLCNVIVVATRDVCDWLV